MKILLLSSVFMLSSIMLAAQSVGINNTGAAPHSSTILHVDAGSNGEKGFLMTGPLDFNSVPNLGEGSRLMFYPGKGAFRAGYVSGTQWNNASVGMNSIAMGYSTTASGGRSTALGDGTIASGGSSTALGGLTIASGSFSTAMGGPNSRAIGSYSTAMGYNTRAEGMSSTSMGNGSYASGTSSIAMGENTSASGSYSTATGTFTIASGNYSTAMGAVTTASGTYSTAMGYRASTNNQKGAFVIGDSDPNNQGVAMPGQPDLFVARFNNGYYLFTSGVTSNIGVALNHNSNAWVSVCDENRKENFVQLNGEEVLQKLSKMNFTSWNYKQQDPKMYRHYGIMAQDFYNAFGHDTYGTIGNDTTVNPIDMIGIDMSAIQALEIRTTALKAENEELKIKNDKLQARLQKLEDLLLKK